MDEKRDAQTRTVSKTQLVEQVDTCLHSGEYSRALDLLRGAASEFPNDAELAELERLAHDGVKRKAEADRLITESQELFAQQKSTNAIKLLREAYELDKHNSLARSILASALVEHAYSIVETDWWEAETLANEALAVNPAHPTAKTILNRILDQKTAGSVEEWVSQTRTLQSSGNLSAALSQIAEGLVVYPRDPKLLQVQDAIQRDDSARRRQLRRRDLEDLRHMASEVDAAADVDSRKELTERIRNLTTKHSTDGEILSVANALLLRLGQLGVPQKSSTASPDGESATRIDHPPLPSPSPIAPEVLSAATGQVSPNWTPSENVPAGTVPRSKVLPRIVPPSVMPLAKVPTTPAEPQLPPPPAAKVPDTRPAEESSAIAARVTPPSSSLPKQATKSNSTTLILVAAAAIIVVATISYSVGTHHAPPAANTLAAAPTVSPATASVPSVSAPTVSAPAQTAPEPPLPASRPSSDGTAGNSTLPKPLTADHPPAAPTPSTFIEPGHNQSSHDLGTLLVVAGQDDAKVFLNGKIQRQLTQAGQLRVPNLELKDYAVQVSKSGFRDPPQQKIRIRRDEETRLVFNLQPNLHSNLQPKPSLAALTIQGGAPGTTVLVDQSLVGTIQPDGTLSVSAVTPGDHTVELRKERFKPREFKKQFVAGGTISLVAADAVL
ncbi:MAG: hypothetical protein WB919_19435, partial [Candidatus Sulfotelmatobacter sp.]